MHIDDSMIVDVSCTVYILTSAVKGLTQTGKNYGNLLPALAICQAILEDPRPGFDEALFVED